MRTAWNCTGDEKYLRQLATTTLSSENATAPEAVKSVEENACAKGKEDDSKRFGGIG